MQPTRSQASPPSDETEIAIRKPPSTLVRVGSYGLVRILTIGITIVVGIFLTVIVANKGNGLDKTISVMLQAQIQAEMWGMHFSGDEREDYFNKELAKLEEEAGLHDPFLKKHLRWTYNALRLDLGNSIFTRLRATFVRLEQRDEIKSIIFSRLPNTLLIVGMADFFVFLIGIPLALYLSRNYGNWVDKIINILSPLSSVPSWVHGVMLILVFAVTFRLLPPGGMIDIPYPETRQAILASRLKHMILPALAIFLSLLFQLVYTWRNYFMIYSNEDYVDFAVAQGLSNTSIQNKYILRPSLPYVLTGFALTLVSFWQMATALEVVFNWDGIGAMYITSLPHFWGETMFPGEMGLTIGIVVIFAYILGFVVLLLDVAYAIVDPRIRLGGAQQRVKPTKLKRNRSPRAWLKSLTAKPKPGHNPRIKTSQTTNAASPRKKSGRLWLILILVVILGIGILLGLALGWQVWPVQYTNASPADLTPAYQVDYFSMLIDSFTVHQNSGLARWRLDALGEQADSAMQGLIQSISDNSDANLGLANFANNFDPSAAYPPAANLQAGSQFSGSNTQRIILLSFIAVGGIAIFAICIWLYMKGIKSLSLRKTQPPKKAPPASDPFPPLSIHSPGRRLITRLQHIFRELIRYPSAVAGMTILALMLIGSLYAVIRFPYKEIGDKWYQEASLNSAYVPRTAYPKWINFFRKHDFPETIIINSQQSPEIKTVKTLDNGNPDYTITFVIDYPYEGFPTETTLYFDTVFEEKKPFATLIWTTPDGKEFGLKNTSIDNNTRYRLDDNIDRRDLADHSIQYKYTENDLESAPLIYGLFADPQSQTPVAVPGTYTLEIKILGFEPATDVNAELVLMGQIYGMAGTDMMRRDLVVPLLWGMPFAIGIGLFGAFLTTIVSMVFAAFGVWFGGWADNMVQRVTEANMILPVVAIAVLFYAFYGASLWSILTAIVILNAFGGPTKTFRAAFIQVKESSFIEAAQAYGAPNHRIIFRYMIPRILPVIIPQLVTLIPGFIFLEATLGMFNVKSNLPTWGKVIYEALSQGAAWGSKFWVLEPIALLLLTGFAFSMMGFALDRILNPRLQQGD